MNQTLIIAHLNYISQGQETLFESRLKGFVTPDFIRDMGMYVCFGCGYVGSVDESHCLNCRDEKFIMSEIVQTEIERKEIEQSKRLKAYIQIPDNVEWDKGKRVINIKTGQEFRSATAAAKSLGITKNKMYEMIKNRISNYKYKSL